MESTEVSNQESSFGYACSNCGNVETRNFGSAVAAGVCFSCDFWGKLAETSDDPTHFVIEGKHYVVGEESQGGRNDSGFGGAKRLIIKFDGTRIETSNLWHQGTVPEIWREKLPDNARFEPLVREL